MELGRTAWIDNIFTRLWPRLEAAAPDKKWMPNVEKTGRSRIVVQEYGCGLYGCVMPTHEPGIVIKLTSDPSEAWFVSVGMRLGGWPEGMVRYYAAFAIPEATFRGRPVYALWRDEAYRVGPTAMIRSLPMGSMEYREMRAFYEHLSKYKELAGDIHKRLKAAGPDVRWLLLADAAKRQSQAQEPRRPNEGEWEWLGRAYPNIQNARGGARIAGVLRLLEHSELEMENKPVSQHVGAALRFYRERGMLLADVHSGNVGHHAPNDRPLEGILITDPGHAVALDKKWATVELPELPERAP